MKKLVILVFSCALQFTYGSEPNIDGTIIANAKSPMDRRDPRLFFGVRKNIFSVIKHQLLARWYPPFLARIVLRKKGSTNLTFGKCFGDVSGT